MILRHRDRELLRFDWLTPFERTIKRCLTRLDPSATLRGAPKTGGYLVNDLTPTT